MSDAPTSPDVPSHVADLPDVARRVLADFLAQQRPEIEAIGAPVTYAFEQLETFVLGGGKRVRPLYGWAGFVGAGGLHNNAEDPAAVVRAVSALELVQACALIHDDIIDQSDTRRGKPTVHRTVERHHRDRNFLGSPGHFGEAAAILIGDLALAWADDMISDSGLSDAALRRIRQPWRAMRTEVIGGQLLDVSLEASGSEDETLSRNVNLYKTAAYTIARPLHIGGAIAGCSPELIQSYLGFGKDIGVAFQLRDDLLGVFGNPSVTGKPAVDDLREGKRTELLSVALAQLSQADPALAEELRAGVGRTTDPEELARLAELITISGAPKIMEARISDLTSRGLEHLKAAHVPSEVYELLHDLALKSTQRVA
ncbi:polyprenyl synthetase family protein [Corynebacterium tapiri]|uniref:Polyprenyl synthetase family protein n=1 Tax=Corynebacterium tapiri TaxID=1448266 RepID=A0A5C4U5E5_9CORY|nr:polyprenyl synthetase family protein [Corynebacterium tapiri]TNL99409.1 polyprenyl synthetase family protein [Corynebacterium tapiri]